MRRILSLIAVLALAGLSSAQQPAQPRMAAPDKPQLVLETGGHTIHVMKVFFTPDGKQLVTVGRDVTIRYWDVQTGELRRTLHLQCHLNVVAHTQIAALSHDRKTLVLSGKYVLEKGEKRPYVFFNVEEARVDRVFEVDSRGSFNMCLALSRDGELLATGNHDGIYVWETKTGVPVQEIPAKLQKCQGVAFGGAGKRVAAILDGKLQVLTLPIGKNKAVSGPLAADPGAPHTAVWFPNNKHVAVCTPAGIEVWDVDEDRKDRTLAVGITHALIWDGPGRLLTGGEQPNGKGPRVNLVEAMSGKELRAFTVPPSLPGTVYDVAPSPDSKTVAAAVDQVVHLWDRNTGELLRTFGGKERPMFAAGWNKDGNTLAWGSRVDPKGKTISERQPLDRAFDLGEMGIVSVDQLQGVQRAILKREPDSLILGRESKIQRAGESVSLSTPIFPASSGTFLSQDRVALGLSNGGLNFYDARTGKLTRQLFQHRAAVMDMAPSPNGRLLLTASLDQTLKIWDVAKPGEEKLLLTLFISGRDWIVWTPQGYYAATPGGEKLMGWTINNKVGEVSTFLPAERFRKTLYRPDVIKLVLEKGSIREAITLANAALPKEQRPDSDAPANVDDLLPPRVKLEAGKPNDKNEVTFKVTASAGVKGQPIASLRLLVNGRPLPADKNTSATYDKGKAATTETWTVALPDGTHQIAVLARSTDASAISEEVSVDCRPAKQRPVLHVLAIGIDQYKDSALNLKCAENDAKLLGATFKTACQGDLFNAVEVQTLLSKDATRDAVGKAVQGLRAGAKANDLVVVTFAGHGAKEKDQFYLLTHEAEVGNLAATALSGARLRDDLKDFPCQVLLILDACHSAGFGAKGKLAQNNLRPATDDATRAFTDDEVGVAVLCAAMGYEKAIEQDGHGLFSKHLAAALNLKTPPQLRNGRQYVHHLHAYVSDKVAEQSNDKQHPFLHLPWTVESFPLRKLPEKAPGSR